MPQSNQLLASLARAEATLLAPHLKHARLEQRAVLFDAGQAIERVYFPTSVVISLVVALSSGEMIESAMVGRDGIVGSAAALGSRISLSRGIAQIGGDAMVCEPQSLRRAALQSEELLGVLVRYEQALYGQAQQSVACIATHQVEARLCRWILRARDLLPETDTLPFTQEFLAEMLGVQRTSVSLAANMLQSAGMIKYARGKIRIVNLEGLQETACECYAANRAHYDALFPNAKALETCDG